MKYLRNFIINESIDILEGLKDCFAYVSDLVPNYGNSGLRFKSLKNKTVYVGRETIKGTNIDYLVMVIFNLKDNTSLHKKDINGMYFDVPFKITDITDETIEEIENAINISQGVYNLTIESILIEHINLEKNGPGIVIKEFNLKRYKLEEIIKFMLGHKDHLRWVKIYYVE